MFKPGERYAVALYIHEGGDPTKPRFHQYGIRDLSASKAQEISDAWNAGNRDPHSFWTVVVDRAAEEVAR